MRRRRVVATTTTTNGSSTSAHNNSNNNTTNTTTTTRTSCLLLPKSNSSDNSPEQSMIPQDDNHNNQQQQQQQQSDVTTVTATVTTATLGDTVVNDINDHHTGIRNSPSATTNITTTSTLPNTLTTETITTAAATTTTTATSSSLSSPLSVTIISQNNLPSYSSERFYLLSELEVHAASTVFLSSSSSSLLLLLNDDHSTQDTEEESFNNLTVNNDNNNHSDDIEDDLRVDPVLHGGDQNQDSNPTTDDSNDSDKSSTTILHPESNHIPATIPISAVPSFFILYILWKPNMTTDPQLLIQDTILPAITQIQQQYDVDIIQSSTLIQNYSNFKSYYHPTNIMMIKNSHSYSLGVSSSSSSSDPTDTTLQQSSSTLLRRSSASIYIVVDRIVPKKMNVSSSSSTTTFTGQITTETTMTTNDHLDAKQPLPEVDEPDDDDDDDEQYRLVESVGRAVASHVQLRDWIDGITIGISDHVRAAPGLELCTDAITKIGNIDRRRYKFHPHNLHQHSNNSSTLQSSSSNGNNNNNNELEAKKSLLSIVAMSKDDLLGLQDITNTDAADFVQQSTVTAEWYGQGDIYMFASRAHFVWKQRYNVLIDSENAMDGIHHGTIPTSDPFFRKRKLPRRISQPNRREVIMLSSNTTRSTTTGSSTNQRYQNNYQMTLQQERELLDDIYDLLGYIWVITFILYHFVKFDVAILTSTYDNIMALIQFMIRVWIDLIRSTRGW